MLIIKGFSPKQFNGRAYHVLTNAYNEAQDRGFPSVEPELIPLALAGEKGSHAGTQLSSLFIEYNKVRELIDAAEFGKKVEVPAKAEDLRFSPRSLGVFKSADNERLSTGYQSITTEHLLIGITRDRRARNFLAQLSVDADDLRKRIRTRTRRNMSWLVEGNLALLQSNEHREVVLLQNLDALRSEIEQLKQNSPGADSAVVQVERISEIADNIEEEGRGLTAPVFLPRAEDIGITLVPSHLLERLEEYRSDENIAYLLIGAFAGAILGILVNWVTEPNFVITRISGFLLALLLVFTAACVFWAHRLRSRSNAIKQRMLYKDISISKNTT